MWTSLAKTLWMYRILGAKWRHSDTKHGPPSPGVDIHVSSVTLTNYFHWIRFCYLAHCKQYSNLVKEHNLDVLRLTTEGESQVLKLTVSTTLAWGYISASSLQQRDAFKHEFRKRKFCCDRGMLSKHGFRKRKFCHKNQKPPVPGVGGPVNSSKITREQASSNAAIKTTQVPRIFPHLQSDIIVLLQRWRHVD